jgi:hypothetical protein
MSIYEKTNWDTKYLQTILSNDTTLKISAIKSYIESDEAIALLENIKHNYNAKIYCLIACFSFHPSVKCIELLIQEGTPLDKTFENNPFNCTPQEFLNKHFNNTTSKIHIKTRNLIYQAIERGKNNSNNHSESITVPKISKFKNFSKNILSSLNKL